MRQVIRYLDGTAEYAYLRALVATRFAALRKARERGDLGASAIELAIITAIIAVVASGLAILIKTVITKKESNIRGL